MTVRRYFLPLAAALIACAPTGASAGADDVGPKTSAATSAASAKGERFVIRELRQADRDLNRGDPRINVLFDTRKGRTWVLQYSRLPRGNAQGYVWVEIPQKKPFGR